MSTSYRAETYFFHDDGMIPNHSQLPVIVYPGALADQPQMMEQTFNQNRWLNSWTNGVFDYHHYHSNCHEVLGVISGQATLQLGGEQGQAVTLNAGDVVLLPAGTGHKRLAATSSFRIVGAYPDGASYNIRTGEKGDHEAALQEIPRVPRPALDPVYGENGPVQQYWS